MKKRSWTENQLREAAKKVYSTRQLLLLLGLKQAGGNYTQVAKYLKLYNIDTSHFRGTGWNKGLRGRLQPRKSLEQILTKNSYFQSYKLKIRLFQANLKSPKCELCGWAERSVDGRLPLELDHINGDNTDNRLENLRILCPNCHSLQSTHRGKNIKSNKPWWRNWYTRNS